jgi:hypothetical protein
MLAAHEKDPVSIPIDAGYKQDLLVFISDFSALLASRLTPRNLTDFSDNPVTGLNFDVGLWDDYKDHAYSGYTGSSFPRPDPPPDGDQIAAVNSGWDISHARRFPHVFDTLYRYRHITGQTFPDATVVKQLSNQLVYGAFNKSLETPQFSNYMSGVNGWYRVGYSGREGFGYQPTSMGQAALTGGYAFWDVFNNDVGMIMDRLWEIVDATDQTYAQQYYYLRIYSNYTLTAGSGFDRTTSRNTLQFLPAWMAKIKPDKAVMPNPTPNACDVSIEADLSWQGAYATTFDVYFGTTNPPPLVVNQIQATFDPGTMDYLTPYFWQINCKNANGTTTGQIWSFITESLPADFDSDGDVDHEDFGLFQACHSGSNRPYVAGCEKADLDRDEDVDLDDFSEFEGCMGGANQPPGC